MKNPFAGLFRARDKPKDSVSAAPTFFFGMSGSGKPVNAQTAIQLSAVYACVRVISETVASLPLGVYEATDDGSQKATDHSLYFLLHDEPNSEMTSFVLREVMLAHLLLYGNSYCQILRSGRNQITGLYPLLPDHMEVDRDKPDRTEGGRDDFPDQCGDHHGADYPGADRRAAGGHRADGECRGARPSVKALWDSFDTAASGAQESVDWVLLYYVGTVVLRMSEDVFWKSTLRKLHAVFRCHCEHMPKPASKK